METALGRRKTMLPGLRKGSCATAITSWTCPVSRLPVFPSTLGEPLRPGTSTQGLPISNQGPSWVGSTAWMQRVKQELLQRLEREHLVLDVGCGTGKLAEDLGEPLHCVGLDASREMLRVAMSRGHKHLVQGDVQSLPFPHGAFNAVLARNLLKHTGNPEQAVSEMLRVTRASGFTLILESCVQDNIDKAFMEMISNHLEPFQGGSLICREILSLAERSGRVEASFPWTSGVVASPDYVMRQYGVCLL